ncbi:hypothetical protein CALCODRAFT_190089 [Calocera cornea HHB12733]|uniref:Uncharacterized protein n=1 Tax=Calocera cornea HHB12733 TaxID=1353952 RepID=A0A165C7T7_9BASI|nr:hypothetical protein CALCODRAFT_190089 [Calocera cornea HHB12733]
MLQKPLMSRYSSGPPCLAPPRFPTGSIRRFVYSMRRTPSTNTFPVRANRPPDPAEPNKWNVVYPILRPGVFRPGVWIGGDLGNTIVAIVDHWEDASWKPRLTREPLALAPYKITGAETVEILKKCGFSLMRTGSDLFSPDVV